ncbi:voltage-gated inwardly rectifying potassium channel KCNH2-like [Cherax quadricarinatus]|uniref:voltage-gated inwardly rectifying potassium channel KCNH2-like n=1 Tax=Cherax quadricarinatus TaxID=27406 RepID=UPI0023798D78|nr:potassium voltage-gated channel subfamily H member 2-like [Cherax quadricarinatus]
MPIRRGHVAPQNLFIDTIIRRFDGPHRAFVVANAQHDCGVIFVNEGFCKMSGFSRADVMQRPCTCDFLHGPLTSSLAIQQLREALATAQERLVELLYYKKDGTKFLCQTTLCPIKNEDGDTCMFIVNFQDMTPRTEEDDEDDASSGDNTIQSRFNRARASFRQSFRMGTLRRVKSPASGPSSSPGTRMAPILDEPAEEPQEEEEEEENAHSSREPDDSDQRDPLLGVTTHLNSTTAAATAADGAAREVPTSPRQSSSTTSEVALPASAAPAILTTSPVEPPATAATAATLVISSDRRVGSFAEESGRSRSSMRPATSLDGISHHRVSHPRGRDFPSRSATITSTARNNILKPFPNASSESDLSRYRTRLMGRDRKSPSLSNLTAEGIKHKFSFQDPNAAKGLFPNAKGHQKIDKVAHVGQVVSTLFDVSSFRKSQMSLSSSGQMFLFS